MIVLVVAIWVKARCARCTSWPSANPTWLESAPFMNDFPISMAILSGISDIFWYWRVYLISSHTLSHSIVKYNLVHIELITLFSNVKPRPEDGLTLLLGHLSSALHAGGHGLLCRLHAAREGTPGAPGGRCYVRGPEKKWLNSMVYGRYWQI